MRVQTTLHAVRLMRSCGAWQGLGASMSTFASHLFVPAEYADAACGKKSSGSAYMQDAELPGFAMTQARTRFVQCKKHLLWFASSEEMT